ncbi:hypothetical protein [Dyella mobilis]|uniref:Uncharacterized protein n=1 Tax=Dyella mobilis TaxID=1849582 RepID=A0ABS2KCK5_9GAMM|nr:hypothetical protein [Dyella mobilis]MBM7128897.1 hypothetical protein [Dyella mobilis]
MSMKLKMTQPSRTRPCRDEVFTTTSVFRLIRLISKTPTLRIFIAVMKMARLAPPPLFDNCDDLKSVPMNNSAQAAHFCSTGPAGIAQYFGNSRPAFRIAARAHYNARPFLSIPGSADFDGHRRQRRTQGLYRSADA